MVGLVDEVHALRGNGQKKAALDLRRADWIASSGIFILVRRYTKFKETGADLRPASSNRKIHQMIVITKSTSVFDVRDTLEKAWNGFEE